MKEMTRKEKFKVIKRFRKLSLKSVCERAGVSRQSVYMETLSDKNLDKIIDIIVEDVTRLWER
ncbi:MAG: hypothetical protein J6T10_11540 [Methanobrevibacter sp.]|nr:hypothetical protein [Methanobrevibacter sp.]